MAELRTDAEIDALVAEKVMGFRVWRPGLESADRLLILRDGVGNVEAVIRGSGPAWCPLSPPGLYSGMPTWSPMSSFEDAMDVVKKMRACGLHFRLFCAAGSQCVYADFGKSMLDRDIRIVADSIFRAICRAALEVVMADDPASATMEEESH